MAKTTRIVEKIELEPFSSILADGTADIIARNKKMVALGIIDARGNLLKRELPEDMTEGSRTDV